MGLLGCLIYPQGSPGSLTMTFRVSCPSCGSACTVPAELCGKKARCGSCQKPFVVPPAPARKPQGVTAARTPPAPPVPAPRRREEVEKAVTARPQAVARRAVADDEEDRPRPKRKAIEKGSKKGLFLLLGGLGGLALIAVVVVIVIVASGSKTDEPVAQAKDPAPQNQPAN